MAGRPGILGLEHALDWRVIGFPAKRVVFIERRLGSLRSRRVARPAGGMAPVLTNAGAIALALISDRTSPRGATR